MHVVVKRLFLNMIQRDRTHSLSLDDLFSMPALDEYATVEKTVLRKESAAELNAHLNLLPPRMQAILKLKLAGFSSREIADQFSITQSAVRLATWRAKRRLQTSRNSHTPPNRSRNPRLQAHPSLVPSPSISNIARLSDPYKTVLALHLTRQMSYRQIALTLHTRLGTVKSQHHRGKKQLHAFAQFTRQQPQPPQKTIHSLPALLTDSHTLPAHMRQALELHELQHLSYTQIAHKLGRPTGTIKGWISRAKAQLQLSSSAHPTPATTRRQRTPLPAHLHPSIPTLHPTYRTVPQRDPTLLSRSPAHRLHCQRSPPLTRTSEIQN